MREEGIASSGPDTMGEMDVIAEGNCRCAMIFRNAVARMQLDATEVGAKRPAESSCFVRIERLMPLGFPVRFRRRRFRSVMRNRHGYRRIGSRILLLRRG